MVSYINMKETLLPSDEGVHTTGPGFLNRINLPHHLKSSSEKLGYDAGQLIVKLSLLLSVLRRRCRHGSSSFAGDINFSDADLATFIQCLAAADDIDFAQQLSASILQLLVAEQG